MGSPPFTIFSSRVRKEAFNLFESLGFQDKTSENIWKFLAMKEQILKSQYCEFLRNMNPGFPYESDCNKCLSFVLDITSYPMNMETSFVKDFARDMKRYLC